MESSGEGQAGVGELLAWASGIPSKGKCEDNNNNNKKRFAYFCNFWGGLDRNKQCVSEKSICGPIIANVPQVVGIYTEWIQIPLAEVQSSHYEIIYKWHKSP